MTPYNTDHQQILKSVLMTIDYNIDPVTYADRYLIPAGTYRVVVAGISDVIVAREEHWLPHWDTSKVYYIYK